MGQKEEIQAALLVCHRSAPYISVLQLGLSFLHRPLVLLLVTWFTGEVASLPTMVAVQHLMAASLSSGFKNGYGTR